MRGAFVDPGGDLPKLKAAAAQAGVTIEKILLTHGHIDHAGAAGVLAAELGVPIEGPHRDDIFWIERLAEDGARYGITGQAVRADPLARRRRHRHRRRADPRGPPLPRPHPRPRRLPPPRIRSSRWSATSCSRARSAAGISPTATSSTSSARSPRGCGRWATTPPSSPDTAPMSTFGHERATNPLVGDRAARRARPDLRSRPFRYRGARSRRSGAARASRCDRREVVAIFISN